MMIKLGIAEESYCRCVLNKRLHFYINQTGHISSARHTRIDKIGLHIFTGGLIRVVKRLLDNQFCVSESQPYLISDIEIPGKTHTAVIMLGNNGACDFQTVFIHNQWK